MAVFDSILGLVFIGLVLMVIINRFSPRSNGSAPTHRRHRVSEEALSNLITMFPHIPSPAIRYDLEKTGNSQRTAENILRAGFLEMPPNVILASETSPGTNPLVVTATGTGTGTTTTNLDKLTLIERYNLSARLASQTGESDDTSAPQRTWSQDKETREQSLRKRKEAMILGAREKMLRRESKRAGKTKAEV